jgi:hypothetical protein
MDEKLLLITCLAASGVMGALTAFIVSFIISKKKSFKHINKLLKKSGKVKNYSEITGIIAAQLEENKDEHQKMDKAIDILNWERRKNIKKVGYVRYDSNPDISGHMSFSLAMLNEENSGIILTNIHMMEGSSIYLREIQNGKCEVTLSEEEKQALKETINE